METLEKIIEDLFNPVINSIDTVNDNNHHLFKIKDMIDNLHLFKMKQLLTLNYVLMMFED